MGREGGDSETRRLPLDMMVETLSDAPEDAARRF